MQTKILWKGLPVISCPPKGSRPPPPCMTSTGLTVSWQRIDSWATRMLLKEERSDIKCNHVVSQWWAQISIASRSLKIFQDFNGIWTRDLAIPVRCSNQLSYEATDVGSWSLLSSQLPVISNYEWKIYMKYIIYCTAGMKSNETMLSPGDERKFLLRREAWKIFRTSTGFEPATSRYRCDALTNWAMKPLTLGAGHFWVHNFPW